MRTGTVDIAPAQIMQGRFDREPERAVDAVGQYRVKARAFGDFVKGHESEARTEG